MAKQISTQYVVKHAGIARRITLVEETNGVARGRFAKVKDLKKPTAAAYSVERFVNDVLIGLDNIEPLVEQTHKIFGIGPSVEQAPVNYGTGASLDDARWKEHHDIAYAIYKAKVHESREEDTVLAELARNRRLYGEHVELSTLLRNRH